MIKASAIKTLKDFEFYQKGKNGSPEPVKDFKSIGSIENFTVYTLLNDAEGLSKNTYLFVKHNRKVPQNGEYVLVKYIDSLIAGRFIQNENITGIKSGNRYFGVPNNPCKNEKQTIEAVCNLVGVVSYAVRFDGAKHIVSNLEV